MTRVYITIDTEHASGLVRGLDAEGRADSFARSIACRSASGAEVGIFHQMDVLERNGHRGIFFVDPMPALVWGVEAIADIVGPILDRGHDVQLHCHTEWLALAGPANPLGGRTGQNLRDFSRSEQQQILEYARQALVAAGAPEPVAFRAGNYGANDDTLRALAALGLRYDSSHCPGIADGAERISLGPDDRRPVAHCVVVEVPVGCIESFGGRLRHAQITALSAREMLAAVRHAAALGHGTFTLVSHSFELFNRRRMVPNTLLKRRFERFCRGLARIEGVATATYRDEPAQVAGAGAVPVLPHSHLRTVLRMGEQLAGNVIYGAGA